MNITSLQFFYLLLVVLVIYYLLPVRPQNYWLLFVSYAFYYTWAWQFCVVLLMLTITTYVLAQKMQNSEDVRTRRWWLWVGIVLNVAALLFFRTANFFLPAFLQFASRFGVQLLGPALEILLPIGLAYYVLQIISYLVDVHRNQMAASTDFVSFALYLAYFPKLLSGPIERARTFLPALTRPRQVDNSLLARSVALILMGLMRKMFVAGILSAIIFWDAFETPAKYTGPELLCWILIYGLYLYNDFAGYTSLVRGISGLFGLELSKNFEQPYFAHSMTDFWNRWHISLSHWLRDYVYFPLSRKLLKRNSHSTIVNLPYLIIPPMTTMLLSGLWHGLAWSILLWGALHGAYQIIERLASLGKPTFRAQKRFSWHQPVAPIVVLALVTFAWVPFVMDLPIAIEYWKGMLNWTYPVVRFHRILLSIPVFIVVLAVDGLERYYKEETFYLRWPRLVRASLLATSLFIILLLLQADIRQPFVYQGF